MNPNLDILLSHLTGVKKVGKEWVARCPNHDDNKASLGVTESDTGTILVNCLAGCETPDVINHFGMKMADLFMDKKLNGHAKSNGHTQPAPEPERITCAPGSAAPTPVLTHPQLGKPTMLHVYLAVDKQLLGYVMRFDLPSGKEFRPYTYSKSDGWKFKMFNDPRPLYGLERLREKPDGARILCEGEKAADAAQRLAPSNACLSWCGGAGSAKYADLEPLRGQPVILWPDADEPGHKAVAELATRLCAIGCSLRIVDTSGLDEGFDAADLKGQLGPWLKPRLKPYTPIAAIDPVTPPIEPAAKPTERPVASVTPITEARTKQQAKPQSNPSDDYAPFADDVLARAFTEVHPELRYVARWGKWLEWGADGWVEDTTLKVYDMARKVCVVVADATRGATPSQVSGAKSGAKVAAVEKMAKADRVHAASTEQWDANPMILSTPGGLIDLTTGSVRPARIEDYCRRITDAKCSYDIASKWLDFLKFGTNGDDELLGFLQRWAGYSATGETKEQKFVFIHGPGGAGKGTFVNTIARVLGTYARKIAMDTLVDTGKPRDGGAPSEDIAGLAGARMGYASETEQGRRWNEARLKEITGEDKMRARFMAKDSFEFQPVIKLSIMGNHPPGLKSVGNDMIRRTLIVPFEHMPPVPDGDLREKLWAERDQILGWIITGTLMWQCDGLNAPESVVKRSADYFTNQDVLGQWIGDCCDVGGGFETTIRALYKSYRPYCEGLHEFALRQGELRDALLSRAGIEPGGYKSAPIIKGIRVRVDTSAHDARFGDN